VMNKKREMGKEYERESKRLMSRVDRQKGGRREGGRRGDAE